jgi:hypothetical protein
MSTHSAIVEKTSTGQYRGIYCHWDGYPDGVGATLKEHYTDPNKVSALIDLGDISSLGENVAPSGKFDHSYGNPEEGVTVAYGRDRGEEGTETKVGATLEEVVHQIDGEYIYLFENGKWKNIKNGFGD